MHHHKDETPGARFSDLVSRDDRDIDLAEAALLLASCHYPRVKAASYLTELDSIAESVASQTIPGSSPLEIIQSINDVLFQQLGFHGNSQDYYNPRNSYLNQVIDRRTGIPITLSIVYMSVAERLDFPTEGIGAPGHFLIKHASSGGDIFIDPYNAGRVMSAEECSAFVAEIHPDVEARAERTPSVTTKQILARMLLNLLKVYASGGDLARATWAIEMILRIEPHSAHFIREHAMLLAATGKPTAAIEQLRRYLELAPNAGDSELIEDRIKEIRKERALLN
jgi:regulator of sirC expression with transglutaminase-like and TPR domain